jgi:hypothetical protein
MFKRIKNLLDISRYTVADLRSSPEPTYTGSGYEEPTRHQPAVIINPQGTDPFKDFADETTEQPLDDTAPRN